MKIEIPVITHTDFELSKFDFSFKDIYLYDIQSSDFKAYIQSFDPENFVNNFDFFEGITEGIHYDYEKYYAVIKKDFKKDFNQEEIFNVYKLLLIIFPSDLQILHIISFVGSEGFLQPSSMSSWNRRTTGEYPGEYLISLDEFLPEINEFIRLAFDRMLGNTNYLGIAVFHYLSSYDASHVHYQYIALCMVLESIIPNDSELTYRLKRNVAVLLGRTPYNCKKLFDNLKKVYDLRSKIVHGEKYDHNKIVTYMPYIKAVASRVIIELLLHDIKNNKDLNDRITEIGYGDRHKISSDYKEYRLNILTYSAANFKKI